MARSSRRNNDEEKPSRRSSKSRKGGKSSRESRGNDSKDFQVTGTTIVTPMLRTSYMFLNQLSEGDSGAKSCSSQLLIPKRNKSFIKAFEQAIHDVGEAKFGKGFKVGRKYLSPLQDGDEILEDKPEAGDHYEDCMVVRAKRYNHLPEFRNQYNEIVKDPDERNDLVVSGWYYAFKLKLVGYPQKADPQSTKGVRANIMSFIYCKEGDRLDSSGASDDDFAHFASEEDDD